MAVDFLSKLAPVTAPSSYAASAGSIAAIPAPAMAPPVHAHAMSGVQRSLLSPVAASAMTDLNAIAADMKAAGAARVANPYVSPDVETYARAGIPAEKAQWIASLGADSWELRHPTHLDETAFEQRVLASMVQSGMAKFPGFADARTNDTLKIHHADELPELGYRSFQLTLYKDGQEFGGVGFGTMNREVWLELRQSGTFAATGSVSGNDYVATWPLAWDGGADLAPPHAA